MEQAASHFTFFFVHVPKTAGSTMQDILGRQYSRRSSFVIASHEDRVRTSLSELAAMSPSGRGTLDVVRGHAALAVEQLVTGPKRFGVFLREPVQQFKSGLYYMRRVPWSRHHKVLKGMNDLADYLDYRLAHGMDNMQTRHLSGVLDAMVPRVPGEHVNIPVDQALFDKAAAWLDRMDHVGLTEAFDASVLMMKEGLGWTRHCFYQVQNRTEGRPDPPMEPALEERFREVYKWDIALHARAKARFERDFTAMGEDFPGRVARYISLNERAQLLYRARALVLGH